MRAKELFQGLAALETREDSNIDEMDGELLKKMTYRAGLKMSSGRSCSTMATSRRLQQL